MRNLSVCILLSVVFFISVGMSTVESDNDSVSVIVLFGHNPAAVQVYEAESEGLFLSMETAQQSVEDDHAIFRAELAALFGVGRARTAAPYSITWEYRRALNGVAITLPVDKVGELENFRSVRAVFPDLEFTLNHPEDIPGQARNNARVDDVALRNPLGMAPGRAAMRADKMHALGYRGEGVLIAVIDTGICYYHAAFEGAFPTLEEMQARNPAVTQADTIDGIFFGRNFFTNDRPATNDPMETRPSPGTNHGTHVAGTIVGRDTGGSTAILGVAPEAQIIAYRVMGAGQGTASTMIAAIEQATYDGVDIVNFSLGSARTQANPANPLSVFSLALNNVAIAYPEIIFVIAAGNSGTMGYYSLADPGTASMGISVGSVGLTAQTYGGFEKSLSWFSSRGPSYRNFEIRPDIMAHGESVLSAAPSWHSTDYRITQGTSMAAPHVSGAAALMLQFSRERGEVWCSEEIKARIMNTAIPINHHGIFQTGAGFIDVYAAARANTIAYVNHDRVATHADALLLSCFATVRTGSFSFGGLNVMHENVNRGMSVEIENRSASARTFGIDHRFMRNPGGARLSVPSSITVGSGETAEFYAILQINISVDAPGYYEGFVYISYEGTPVARLPFAFVVDNIREARRGDANGDGRITTADVTRMARFILDPNTNIDLRAADMTGTGTITPADITALMRVLVGLDPL